MEKNRGIVVSTEDNFFTKILKNLKSLLTKTDSHKEEVVNRRAVVIGEEKIERKYKKSITMGDLNAIDENVSKDLNYINGLDEEELNLLDDYYDNKIAEMEEVLNNKKSEYFKIVQSKRM